MHITATSIPQCTNNRISHPRFIFLLTNVELEIAFKRITGEYFQLDIVGSGPEEEEIRRAFHGRSSSSNRTTDRLRSLSDYDDGMMMAKSSSVKDKMDQFIHTMPRSRFEFRKDCIPSNFLGRMDHATMRGDYKIFVNPSVTEVLCTTTAEVRICIANA